MNGHSGTRNQTLAKYLEFRFQNQERVLASLGRDRAPSYPSLHRFSLSRAEKGRNPMHLQRAVYMLMGLGSRMKMGGGVAFCQPHNGGHRCLPASRGLPGSPHRAFLPTIARLQSTAQTSVSRETRPAFLPLISSPTGGPRLFCTQKLSSPRLAHSHLLSNLTPHPAQALPSAQQGGHSRNQGLLRGRGLLERNIYSLPTGPGIREKHLL